MLNLGEIKKQAETRANEANAVNGTINMNDLFKTSGTFVLSKVGYHNFKIVETNLTDNALILKGKLVDDDGNALDNDYYTVTMRVFADGSIFRQQYRDILEQLDLPLNSDFSALDSFIDKSFVIKVIKNARGYAQYYFNKEFIIQSIIEDMNSEA